MVRYQISQEESRRLDLLRGICIVMVVYIHSFAVINDMTLPGSAFSAGFQILFSQVLCRSAVPMLFVISSVLLFRKEFAWWENVKKKFQSLMIPYLIVQTLWIVFYAVAQRIPALSGFFASPENQVGLWDLYGWVNGYLGLDGEPLVYALWYLRDLFVLNLIAPALKWLIDRVPKLTFLCLSLLWVFNVETGIFCLETQSLVFFSLGYYVVKYQIRMDLLNKLAFWKIGIAYALFAVLDMIFGSDSVAHQILAVVGVVFWLKTAICLSGEPIAGVLHQIAEYSFMIYLFHEPALSLLKKVGAKVFGASPWIRLGEYLVYPLVIIALCMLFSAILKKRAFVCYSILNGKRKLHQ